jgi:hypothetical protein
MTKKNLISKATMAEGSEVTYFLKNLKLVCECDCVCFSKYFSLRNELK